MFDLEFKNVSKRYLGPPEEAPAGRHRFLEPLLRWRDRRPEFWALRGIDFHVSRGEALGIIGHNGAGKSTLLKLLAGVTAPTTGEIVIHGTISALIEVGAGFHPELTGRENIFLSGVILGMTRKEVSAKLPGILAFAELGRFIDAPVKRYSSGMYLRLGFAIAAHLEPDIVLLDEVLTVGDVAFQAKCLNRVLELKESGTTIVFVSHDLAAVERLCDRTLLLSKGRIVFEGKPREATHEYQNLALADAAPASRRPMSRVVECTGFSYRGTTRAGDDTVRTGEAMVVRLNYVAHQRASAIVFNLYLYWPSGYLCAQLTSGAGGIDVEPGGGHVEFTCPLVTFCPGLFLIDLAVERYPEVIDWKHRCGTLRVDIGKPVQGDLYLPYECAIEQARQPAELRSTTEHDPSNRK